MTIKISPNHAGYLVHVDGECTGATYRTYDGAVRVANAITDGAIIVGVLTIQYCAPYRRGC